jgi:hypothetical protein
MQAKTGTTATIAPNNLVPNKGFMIDPPEQIKSSQVDDDSRAKTHGILLVRGAPGMQSIPKCQQASPSLPPP